LPTVFAIESSCDETSAAICMDGNILCNIIATQQVHEAFGGVVPELASRAHMQNIVPVVAESFEKANINIEEIDAFAFTQAPGLIGSLLVGAQFAKSMAIATNKPVIAVHHMQAHVLANLITPNPPQFPFLCLTVSGGHTQIVLCKAPLDMEILGQTIDDAAGEAFDKTAKILGLPYPGGPLVDKYAALGNPTAFKFAEPQIPELNFSFSGFKTSILYFVQKQVAANPNFIQENLADLCASAQYTIIQILLKKLKKAVKLTNVNTICLAGGVSANTGLRNALIDYGKRHKWQIHIPDFEYCTDNAGMIAITGYYKYLAGDFSSLSVSADARSNW